MNMLVIDGNSIINRAFYGIRPLTTRDGRHTNAIYGFLTMLGKIMKDVQPDHVAIAFDMRAPTFRHLKYSGYKAKRKGMPEELASQMQPLKDILAALGYTIVTAEGWEADDILGTLSANCRKNGDTCVIATGDRDTLQLIGGGVTVRLLTTSSGQPTATLYDEDKVREVYGVDPAGLIEIKAIQGDTSDNIPGVPGIGEKGAQELIGRYGTLDGVYENIDDPLIKAGMRKKLIEGRESAYLSRWLGTVQTDAPVPLENDHYAIKPVDGQKVRALMTDLELFSLMKKMDLPEGGTPAPAEEAGAGLPKEIRISFGDAASCAASASSSGRADFICGDSFVAVCTPEEVIMLDDAAGAEYLRAVCGDGNIKKRTHDIKSLAHRMSADGVELRGFIMDTMLAAYLDNPSSGGYSLDRLCDQYLGAGSAAPPFFPNAAQAVRFTPLCDKLAARIEENGESALLRDIEIPLAIVLADMESAGFAVDREGIEQFGSELDGRIAEIEKEIWASVGYEFNINSPKQLGDALFVKLGLPGGKKTKTGYSTNADVLEGLRGQHIAVDKVLEYRTLAKLNSTYCKGLVKAVEPDGRIRTSFNQVETRTGRISSTEPNLQNIPVRTELGRQMRRFFCAEKGNVLIDADYSQIELRVLAHMAGDTRMRYAFESGTDIHRVTASQVFGVPESDVTPEMRSAAKAVNFGIVYGISAFSLSKDIGVTVAQAKEYIAGYMRTYSAVAKFMSDSIEQARSLGYAKTLYGRRRYLPEITSSNFNVRSFGERVARNMPIQGTAADIIKLAMVRVHDRLRAEGMRSRLIMQVHDELIIEAPEEEASRAAGLLREEMMGAASLSVSLEADVHSGSTWLEAKG